MRIKLDENLDARLAAFLREVGHHDITTVQEQNLYGTTDEALYEVCKMEGCILVTLDLDFSNVLRFPPSGTSGIVVLRGPNQLFGTMRILIETLVNALAKESPIGRLWIVEPGHLRIHEKTND